jgi:RNA polymerase sigma-70 factor, ECF subfamily
MPRWAAKAEPRADVRLADTGQESPHTEDAYLAAYSAAKHAALRVLADDDDAADAASEAFAQFWRANRHAPESVRNLPGYMRTAGRWQALMTLRQRRALERLQARLLAAPPGSADAADTAFERERLPACIEQLPPQCRRVMYARLVEGLTPSQTASTLGLSPKAVETQVTRGVRLLREMLADRSA